jgi:dCTP deaminase
LEPGQFAYLITKERINLPNRTIGFINVNTGTKIKGLINISGFHVDPGYHGKLIFTVFNASPQTITLYEGQPIFRLWLSDFDGVGGESDTSYDSLPKELVDRLYGTYPSPFALASRINAIENRLEDLKAQRSQLLLGLFLIGFLLLPFVVNLYSSLLAPWFSDESKVSMDASKQRAAPTAVIPAPAASTPSTGATPGVSEPPKP